jgi:hypothetical protein
MLTCGLMSAFMNNIGATAVLLPAVVGISRQAKVPLSRLLIPLSFSSLMGGNMTLIGTPPNVLAANMLAERGLRVSLSLTFTRRASSSLARASSTWYCRPAPASGAPAGRARQQAAAMREYVSEVRVLPDSKLAGKTLLESRLGADYDLTVLAIIRDGQVRSTSIPTRA